MLVSSNPSNYRQIAKEIVLHDEFCSRVIVELVVGCEEAEDDFVI